MGTITAYGTLIIAFATILLAGATFALAYFSYQSIKAIKETQHAEVFPYPHIESGGHTNAEFYFNIVNRGRGPAIDLEMTSEPIGINHVQINPPSPRHFACFEKDQSTGLTITDLTTEEREFLVRVTQNYTSLFGRTFRIIAELKIKSAATSEKAFSQILSERLQILDR